MIDAATASRFARIALGHVGREYPHKLDQVLTGDADLRSPRALHPAFYGSFDWHSCVHGWWLLLTLRRLHPDLPEAAEIAERADATLTPANILAECAYLERPGAGGFERPYGWAWALALHLEAERHAGAAWAEALYPLAHAFADRFREHLPRLTYPIRTGTHGNTAFALVLMLDWAEANAPDLAEVVALRSVEWFGPDRNAPAWEPGGDDFLSPALTEAILMARIYDVDTFRRWLDGYFPGLAAGEPTRLFTPAIVSDRSDGKIAHLDGLNLSRAWAWRRLASKLKGAISQRLRDTADAHEAAALPHLEEDYAGAHWLATFALLARLTLSR